MLVSQHLQAMRKRKSGLQQRGELAKYLVAVMRVPAVSLRASGEGQRMQVVPH